MRTRTILLAAAACVATAFSARAADSDSVQDLVFLGDDRPVLVRLNIDVDGTPFRKHQESFFRKLFRHLDRDNDGFLSKDEAGRSPNRQVIARARSNGYFFFQAGQFASLKDFDTQPFDSKVAIDEFVAYYRKAGLKPLQISAAANGVPTTELNNAIYRHLDRDGDGKLSKEECDQAPRYLRKFDTDDDETIAIQELTSNPYGQFNRQPTPSSNLFVEPEDLARVIAHYDRDNDKRLAPAEIGLKADLFKKLDTDNDGFLGDAELRGFFATEPELNLAVKLGKTQTVTRQSKNPDDIQLGNDLTSRFGNAELRVNSAASSRSYNYGQNYIRQFDAFDRQKKGILTAKQLENAQLRFLKLSMAVLDQNGDGDLTRAEIVKYSELLDEAAESWITVTVQSRGQGLFQLLDANSDGRLGIREQRTLWARLQDQDMNKDGALAKDELPRQVQATVSCGRAVVRNGMMMGGGNVRINQPNPRTPVQAARGPLWFRKMDSNSDGDVSAREFLGGASEFARIDRDSDGLISLEEAEGLSTVKAETKP